MATILIKDEHTKQKIIENIYEYTVDILVSIVDNGLATEFNYVDIRFEKQLDSKDVLDIVHTYLDNLNSDRLYLLWNKLEHVTTNIYEDSVYVIIIEELYHGWYISGKVSNHTDSEVLEIYKSLIKKYFLR